MKRITKIEATNNSVRKKLRVAAYARVSTDTDKQLMSLDVQKNHYERYIKARPDWEFAGLYYDEGVSGTSMAKRDGLLRMLGDCDRGLIDYLIVKSVSRFSRNTVESIETVRKLSDKGIYIYFEKENIDTGKMEGELLLSILSSLAENESRSISENETWAIQKRFMDGTYKIGYPPYGYDNVDGKMVVNREQAEVVRWIFAEILSGGSPGSVAKELNRRGIPTKRGAQWKKHVIKNMIRNEKYTGDATFQKTYTDSRYKRHTNYGEKSKYKMTDHHEAIISHEDFDAVQAIIAQNGMDKGIRKNEEKYKNRYAMSGKIICGKCGATWRRVRLDGYYGFACNTHLKDKESCSMMSIPEEPVKAAFVTMMNKLTYGRSHILIPLLEKLRRGQNGESSDRLLEIDDLLGKNAERKLQITQFFSKGLLDPAVYAEEVDMLAEEAQKLAKEKDTLMVTVSGNKAQQEALAELLKYTRQRPILTEFDEALFTRHVDHIIVFERTEIGFAMKCGPVFRERI